MHSAPLLAVAVILLSVAIQCSAITKRPDRGAKVSHWSAHIKTWKPSAEMSRNCPYYHAGYDFDGRPVMIAEIGKWNSQKYADMDNSTFQEYINYGEKFWWRVARMQAIDSDAEDGAVAIIDLAGFDNRQLASSKVITFMLNFGRFSALAEPQIAEFLIINASQAAAMFKNLIGLVSGRLAGRVEIIGSRKEVWMAKLRHLIPIDQLPTWYGGKAGFKPVQVYG